MFRFQLAPSKSVPLEIIQYPVIASPKLDGCRTGQVDGRLVSRTLKTWRNEMVSMILAAPSREGWDGELISGPPNAPDVYNRTQSQVMSRDGGTSGLCWYLFDNFIDPFQPYITRYLTLPDYEQGPHIKRLEQVPIHSRGELEAYEATKVAEGYEGVMLRDPTGYYKSGRASLREAIIFKLKQLLDGEVIVTGFVELEKNENELTTDERGYAKRSSHRAGKVPMNTLGALLVDWFGRELRVGIFKGFTKPQLKAIWDSRERYLGRRAKIQYLPPTKDLPRSARLVGWREGYE